MERLSGDPSALWYAPVLWVRYHRPPPTLKEFLEYFGGGETYYVPPCTYSGDPYGGLERYWREGFALMFLEWFHPGTGHTWTLTPASDLPAEDPEGWPWHQIDHRAKVRFSCQDSGHGWTSMNGLVAFAFRLKRLGDRTIGEVVFKLYGQQCNRCAAQRDAAAEPIFETPLWYPEEIYLALLYLKKKVGVTYYGYGKLKKTPQGIRPGKPKHPHLPEKCQACRDGLCRARCN